MLWDAVAIPDALVVVLCLLVCQFRVLDAVLDCLDMSVRECEVASIVWVFHEAVVDIVSFCPAWFDGARVVFVEIVDAVDGACLLACLGEDRQQHGA